MKPGKGNVIHLFDYLDNETGSQSVVASEAPEYRVFGENDSAAREEWGEVIYGLLATYGADDALAINRKQMADAVFLSSARNGLFFIKCHSGVLFAVCYAGEDAHYSATLAELKHFAETNDLQINLMAQDARVDALREQGFSTTPMGIWQRIEPISEFTLDGSKMRRLRYMVGKYVKSGDCRNEEYRPGALRSTDEAICELLDQWVELKGQVPPFDEEVKRQIREGTMSEDHRFFLTWRNNTLDNVIVLSRDNYNDGYLMDLEFYARDMPLGSTEFAMTEIIRVFNEEGRKVVSLGLTMGTGLFEHENGSPEVHDLFESLRKADYLNGDANAQYKNKYRPKKSIMFLARPQGSGRKKLNDLMMLLGTG